MSQSEKIGESRAYWTHNVKTFPEPVAQFRMAQLIDFDDRLYETARVVYRFMVGWYHGGHGDALLSQRYVAKVMKQRAPAGAMVPSRNAVQRAIIALMDTGWVVRTFQGRGKGKGASRYVPVLNVLELAAQGKFPKPAHATGPVEPAHANGPLVARTNGPVDGEPAHVGGPKTLIHDPRKDAGTSISSTVSAAPPADGLTATAAAAGFERIWVVYGKLGSKKASRAAFEAIENPDVELIVERAASWAASAKPGQRRMPLEKWLAQEKWDEADRKTKALENRPASPNTEKRGKPKVAPKPANGKRKSAGTLATIVDGSLDGDVLAVTFRRNDAAKSEATHRLHGRYIDQLAAAVGGLPDNFEDLIGARVRLDESDGDVAIEAPASWLRQTVQATNILGGRT